MEECPKCGVLMSERIGIRFCNCCGYEEEYTKVTRTQLTSLVNHLKNRIDKLKIGSNGCLLDGKHDLKNIVDDVFGNFVDKRR